MAARVAQYAALVSALDARVTLSFAQIEEIMGSLLAVSAQVAPTYWTSTQSAYRLPAELRAIGWQARLDVRAHIVAFQRVRRLCQ